MRSSNKIIASETGGLRGCCLAIPRRSALGAAKFGCSLCLSAFNWKMELTQALTVFLAVLALSLPAAEATNSACFPMSGFSIAPLDMSPGGMAREALVMSLPASEDFAGNVNVQIQPYDGTIEDYAALSLKQFKFAKVKMISHKKAGASGVVFEYSGEMQGRALHWYARAEKAAGQVYLATATATVEDWSRQARQLKACVDSLRCEPRGAASAASPHR
jgi:hypothetical protein